MPAELKRESVNDPFQLFPVDEEIIINPALVVKLGDDFKIEIPLLPDDWESVPLEKYLKSFKALVEEYKFNVKQECWLGLFSFHKLVIYHDLKKPRWTAGDTRNCPIATRERKRTCHGRCARAARFGQKDESRHKFPCC